MSTNFPEKSGKVMKGAMFVSLWFLACSIAWSGSSLSGGDVSDKSVELAIIIGKTNNLTRKCVVQASKLAEASIRAEIADFRPTSRYLRAEEKKEIDAWSLSGCPDRALVGISYGVLTIARDDIRKRRISIER